jgi:hypothetical protein
MPLLVNAKETAMNAMQATVPGRNVNTSCRRLIPYLLAAVLCLTVTQASAGQPQDTLWQAGVATITVTPEQSMWMAGYAARTKPAEGKVHDLKAKALVLEDTEANRLAIVTLDLIGIDRSMRDWIEKQVQQRHGIAPASLLINASHTHCGPVLRETRYSIYGDSFYGLTPEQAEQSRTYSEQLQARLVDLVGKALENLAPAHLAYTHARAGFAMNRRLKVGDDFHNRPNPDGPVDHDVPVLRVDAPDGKLRAILFGYACHATTLSFYQFCGDYPGFAQYYLEESHPGTTALFMAGCGGDQNPYPRRKAHGLQLCQQHGRTLANAVDAALEGPPKPVRGPLNTAIKEVTLDFAPPPSRETLQQQAKSKNKYERQHAEFLLNQLEHEGKITDTYPYLIQAVQFGEDLTLIALAGEVVIDYPLRFKKELGKGPLWVAGYSNDVFGYIPSLRVLKEGGYEAGGAMRYTPLPGPFAPSVEDRVVKTVHELTRQVRTPQGK